MENSPRNIIRSLLIGFAAVAVIAAGYLAVRQKGLAPGLFSGDIGNINFVNIASEELDPLISGRPCNPSGRQTLTVEPSAAGVTYDWTVYPTANVLSENGLNPAPTLTNVGSSIRFVPPRATDPGFGTVFTVEAVPHGAPPSGGTSGAIFEITISPPCITGIEFGEPSGAVSPDNGKVLINTLRATLSSGQVVEYTSDEIGRLGIDFSFEPAAGVRMVDNIIEVAFDHKDIAVNMQISGNSTEPTVLPRDNRVDPDAADATLFPLASSYVDPASVIAYLPDTTDPNEPGALLNRGVDYVFVNNDPGSVADAVQWSGAASDAPAALFIAYSYRSTDAVIRSTRPLTIAGNRCELLQAQIFQGRGQGFYVPDEDETLPTGSMSVPFDFATGINSILLSNPGGVGFSFGSDRFEYRFDFTEGMPERAVLKSRSSASFEVNVRREADPVNTAQNFAYAINSLLADSSPFIAYTDTADNHRVVLHSMEVGAHTNNYRCSANDAAFPAAGACFSGGTDGSTDSVVVDPPRPLDPTLHQGETRIVYSRGGIPDLAWRTSDASILSVASLSESDEENIVTSANVDLNDNTVTIGQFDLPELGTVIATPSNCTTVQQNDAEGNPVDVLESCDITVTAPFTFRPASEYTITINPTGSDPVSAKVAPTSAAVTGTFNGTATVLARTTGLVTATDEFTFNVGGAASGPIKVTAELAVTIKSFTTPQGVDGSIWRITGLSGSMDDVNLNPSDRTPDQQGVIVTNFAVLSAKRPGDATLTVTDARQCTAALDVSVLGEKLFIGFADSARSQLVEPGDSVQLRAWTGYRGSVNAEKDVTAQVEWMTDDPTVLQVSPAGRVKALTPGTANVFARFTSTTPETGPLTSEGVLSITVDELQGLTIALDSESLGRLPAERRAALYRSVAVLLNSPGAAGRSLRVEGVTVPATLPDPGVPYADELEQIAAIAQRGAASLQTLFAAIPGVRVAVHPNLPGAVLIESAAGDANGMVDISTTASPEEIAIIPAMDGGIDLPPTDTYRLMAVAEYASGRTRLLPLSAVRWVGSPLNILDDASLETGLLRRGDAAGTANVTAEFDNPDGTIVRSNAIPVRLAEGPQIDLFRRLGADAILRGTDVKLQVRVRDVHSVSDLQEMRVTLERGGVTFKEIDYTDRLGSLEVSAASAAGTTAATTGTAAATAAGAATAGTAATAATGTPATARTGAAEFKTFELTFPVPNDSTLYDGPYEFVITILDKAGHTASRNLPFLIGQVASGDVNGDGRVNMIDVILSYQIVNGRLPGATPRQLEAANVDGRGKVTMIDVILLFTRVNRAT